MSNDECKPNCIFHEYGLCSQIRKLWTYTKAQVKDIDQYSDQKYRMDNPSMHFAYILTWGPRRDAEEIWNEMRQIIGQKDLSEMSDDDLRKIRYPLKWQNEWLKRLVEHLREKHLSVDEFLLELQELDYCEARKRLQNIVKSESVKIIDCWLRDIVGLDAFPIDSHVRKVLSKYGIPDEPTLVSICASAHGIPVRLFARAMWEVKADGE